MEYGVCRQDSSGIADCADISACFFACRGNDEECRSDCYWAGTIEGQDGFGDALRCMVAEGCNTPDMCEPCAAEFRACNGGMPQPPMGGEPGE